MPICHYAQETWKGASEFCRRLRDPDLWYKVSALNFTPHVSDLAAEERHVGLIQLGSIYPMSEFQPCGCGAVGFIAV